MTSFDIYPQQILCLEHDGTYLYGEVIQIISQRSLCWFRPIALCQFRLESPSLFDLRQGADLLCPASLLRMALDTEVLPILTQLEGLKAEASEAPPLGELQANIPQTAHDRLQQFIRQVWQAQPEAFQQ
jgi:hypothetical protein